MVANNASHHAQTVDPTFIEAMTDNHSILSNGVTSSSKGEVGARMRIDWVDYAKGFCIILVVMMHSTLRMGDTMNGTGWMHYVVEFARPFRMPDFFLISGLFLANVIDRDWRLFLDRKVVHFFYFYVLWVLIQFAFKTPFYLAEGESSLFILSQYLMTFVQPFGTLWFIYLLPVFFVITKLLRNQPWYVLIAVAAFMEIVHVKTGWITVDELGGRYFYFVSGYLFAPHIFRFASWAMKNVGISMLALIGWGMINGVLVFSGFSQLPFVSLLLGSLGACAVVLASSLLSKINMMKFLRYLGKNSIVIYLAFFFPMGVFRLLLARYWPELDIGTMSLIVTFFGVLVPVIMFKTVQIIGLGHFLFNRPKWAYLSLTRPNPKAALHPAE